MDKKTVLFFWINDSQIACPWEKIFVAVKWYIFFKQARQLTGNWVDDELHLVSSSSLEVNKNRLNEPSVEGGVEKVQATEEDFNYVLLIPFQG